MYHSVHMLYYIFSWGRNHIEILRDRLTVFTTSHHFQNSLFYLLNFLKRCFVNWTIAMLLNYSTIHFYYGTIDQCLSREERTKIQWIIHCFINESFRPCVNPTVLNKRFVHTHFSFMNSVSYNSLVWGMNQNSSHYSLTIIKLNSSHQIKSDSWINH